MLNLCKKYKIVKYITRSQRIIPNEYLENRNLRVSILNIEEIYNKSQQELRKLKITEISWEGGYMKTIRVKLSDGQNWAAGKKDKFIKDISLIH